MPPRRRRDPYRRQILGTYRPPPDHKPMDQAHPMDRKPMSREEPMSGRAPTHERRQP